MISSARMRGEKAFTFNIDSRGLSSREKEEKHLANVLSRCYRNARDLSFLSPLLNWTFRSTYAHVVCPPVSFTCRSSSPIIINVEQMACETIRFLVAANHSNENAVVSRRQRITSREETRERLARAIKTTGWGCIDDTRNHLDTISMRFKDQSVPRRRIRMLLSGSLVFEQRTMLFADVF